MVILERRQTISFKLSLLRFLIHVDKLFSRKEKPSPILDSREYAHIITPSSVSSGCHYKVLESSRVA